MRILFATSEIAPIAKAGGLADVSAALTAQLHRAGHDVKLFVPRYRQIAEAGLETAPVAEATEVTLHLGPWVFTYSLLSARWPDGERPVYLVDCPHLFDRPFLYTDDADEHVRFVLFCRAVLESAQRLQWAPDVVHANDWPTALLPVYLRTLYSWDRLFQSSRSVLSIHNIAHQGVFPDYAVGDAGLENDRDRLPQDDRRAGRLNILKTGILHADAVTTVSATYAREIQTVEGGAGLHDLLYARRDVLAGIVNGVDTAEWNPAADPHIPHAFSASDLSGKRKNKLALLEELGLAGGADDPLLGVVSRLTHQKGFDLFFDTIPDLLTRRRGLLAVLGGGEGRYVDFFRDLETEFPGRVAFREGYNNPLAHRIEAGSDLFLMPSLYEPCGLNQMYSFRYGTIPVVRRTGGLADTVFPFDPATGRGNGFVFDHFDAAGFRWALDRALDVYEDGTAWATVVGNAMAEDFSWAHQTPQYEALYRRIAGAR